MTVWHLENCHFEADISATGGELIRLWDRRHKVDRLWQATPGVWNNSATQLFPVVGRLIHDGLWDDETFLPLAAHGFLRHQTFYCIDQQPDGVLLEAKASAGTLSFWPWQWRIQLHLTLHDDGVSLSQRVYNDDGQAFSYSLGWHPGFPLPVTQPGWQVEFAPAPVGGPFCTQDRTLSVPAKQPQIAVFHLTDSCFQSGAVYFSDCQQRQITVRSPEGRAVMRLETGEQEWLALWGVPGVDLLCIEPLAGTTDDPSFSGQLSDKRGLQRLAAGGSQAFDTRLRFAVDA